MRTVVGTVVALHFFSGCGPVAESQYEAVPADNAVSTRQVVREHPEPKPWDFSGGTIIDLSYPFDDQTVYWPTAEGFRLQEDFVGMTEKGYFYSAYRFSTAEHGGTHIDSPVHFAERGQSVDELPLSRLMGEGVVVDVRRQCAENRDYQIGVADLRNWEVEHQRQLVDVILLLRTGFSQFWPDRARYLGTGERGAAAVAKLHFPGLHPDAAKWLVEHRQVKLVGIDTASIDYGQSTLFESHVTLFKANVPALENVADCSELPPHGFTLIALPMKIRGGSGGPVRIVAVVPAAETGS